MLQSVLYRGLFVVGWSQGQDYIPWSSGDTALSVWTSSTDTKASSSEILTDSGDLWNEVMHSIFVITGYLLGFFPFEWVPVL